MFPLSLYHLKTKTIKTLYQKISKSVDWNEYKTKSENKKK